jgi:hypothetical protein
MIEMGYSYIYFICPECGTPTRILDSEIEAKVETTIDPTVAEFANQVSSFYTVLCDFCGADFEAKWAINYTVLVEEPVPSSTAEDYVTKNFDQLLKADNFYHYRFKYIGVPEDLEITKEYFKDLIYPGIGALPLTTVFRYISPGSTFDIYTLREDLGEMHNYYVHHKDPYPLYLANIINEFVLRAVRARGRPDNYSVVKPLSGE